MNDLSKKESPWVEENINFLQSVMETASAYSDYEEMFKTVSIFPNQLFELAIQSNLKIDDGIPDKIKELYDKIVKPSLPVKAALVLDSFARFLNNKEKRTARSLTEQIETIFSFDGEYRQMNEHHFKGEILEIIDRITVDPSWVAYFPTLNGKRANVILDMVTEDHIKNDIFSIVSLDPKRINLLGNLAKNRDLESIIQLGQEAFDHQRQENASFQHKYAIGRHIEKVLRERLAAIIPVAIRADIEDEQNGQDIVVKFGERAVFYIEVKSRWDSKNSIRMSKNQTIKAYEQSENYALCSVDMSKYTKDDRYEVDNVDAIRNLIRFNTDIGKRVAHLIEVLSQTNENDSIHLDGELRTLIPMTYVEEGQPVQYFEDFLIDFLRSKAAL